MTTDTPIAGSTPDRPLRAGVVGLGWAGQQHMLGYSGMPDVELVGIAGKEAELLAECGERYGVENRFDSLDDLLAHGELDVISIATPTGLHQPMTVQALDAGVHVLIEKPMAESLERAQAMTAAATANDRVLEVTFNKRRGREVQTLAQLITDGALGKIYYVKAGWLRRRGIPGLGTWFTNKDLAGGGPMMDIGIHALDMALHLMGEPEVASVTGAVYAEFGPRGLGGSQYGRAKFGASEDGSVRFDVEDLGTAFIRTTDGATLLLEASWAQWIPEDRFYATVFGTEGGATLEVGGGPNGDEHLTITTDLHDMPATIKPVLLPDGGHVECVVDFVDVVRSGQWDGHRGEVGLKRTAIIDAAYASAAAGREVTLG